MVKNMNKLTKLIQGISAIVLAFGFFVFATSFVVAGDYARECGDGYEAVRNDKSGDEFYICCPKPSSLITEEGADNVIYENSGPTKNSPTVQGDLKGTKDYWTSGKCRYLKYSDDDYGIRTYTKVARDIQYPICPVGMCLVSDGSGGREKLCYGYKENITKGEPNAIGKYCDPNKNGDLAACAAGGMCFSINLDDVAECPPGECLLKYPGSGSGGELEENPSVYCEYDGDPEGGIVTAIGCVPVDKTSITNWLVKFATGLAGFLVVFRIAQGGIMMMTATGNPDKIQEAREIMTSAIIGLLVIIGAVAFLQLIGVTIFELPGFEEITFGG